MSTLVDAASATSTGRCPLHALQRAQPIYLSHHLLAWFWMAARDRERFRRRRRPPVA